MLGSNDLANEAAQTATEPDTEPEPEGELEDLDLSDLEEIPLADEVEEIEEVGADDEFVPVAELASDEAPGGAGSFSFAREMDDSPLEEVPEEIPYLEEVQEEMEVEELDMGTLDQEFSEPGVDSGVTPEMEKIPEIEEVDTDIIAELSTLEEASQEEGR